MNSFIQNLLKLKQRRFIREDPSRGNERRIERGAMMGRRITFSISNKDHGTKARVGKLFIGDSVIRTPIFWLGHQIKNKPIPWHHFDVFGVLVNACSIISRFKASKQIEEMGIRKFLGFSGPIMMDSGGFLFQKKEKVDANPLRIMDLYEKSRPDICVILDHPLTLNLDIRENKKRLCLTLENTKVMYENNGGINLLPVVHGYTVEDIYHAIGCIKNTIGNPPLIGIGSLVPLIKSLNGRKKFIISRKYTEKMRNKQAKLPAGYLMVDIIKLIRKEFPKSFLHVFGIGGATTMHLMFSLGVDSIDSIGWRIKAANGAIQLPGVGDRFVSPKKAKRTGLSEKNLVLLEKCQCPICRGNSLPMRKKLLDNAYSSTFNNRAIHNAWVFQQEVQEAWKFIKKGDYMHYVHEHLKNSPMKKFFGYAFEEEL